MRIKFSERIQRTPTVESFRFLPEEDLSFVPGQFLQLIFDEQNPANSTLNKHLSFSSPPGKGYIEVTKRISESVFSARLKDLKPNDTILIKGPLGACVFKEEYNKIAFLIGGIGITPVISIIGYIIDKNLTTDVLLFYSNRTEEEIAFKKELDDWRKTNLKIKVFFTISESQPKDKDSIFGRIDKGLLSEKIKDLQERIFFIFGPPKMVEMMNALCLELGSEKENIKTENFIGY